MTYLAGKIALDINAGAPNNGRGADNRGMVKQLRAGDGIHPYVSAQAFRRWLRDSVPPDEPRSEVTRSGTGKNQQAYTAGRPDKFWDDDLFGYMVALKGDNIQRDTVLSTGTLVSVAPQRSVDTDFGTMSRGFKAGENPVIHEHELYTAVLAGDVLIDLPRVGVFETDGSGLRIALTKAAATEAEKGGAERVMFRGNSALRLAITERRRRAALLLHAMAGVRGGAKQALNYGDRTPSFVLLAPVKGGNNPFTRVFAATGSRTDVDSDTLREEIGAWSDELDGPVLVGWAPGFLGDQRERCRTELTDLIERGILVIKHPRALLAEVAERIQHGDHDGWFQDAKE